MHRPDEDRLEDSSRKLRLAVSAARLGIWDWDLVRNEMHYSARARSIFGFPEEGAISFEMVRDATHPEDHPRTSAAARKALDPAVRSKELYEYRIIRADNGEVRWVVAHGEAVFRDDGDGTRAVRYVGTIEDITDRKSTEQALRESELRQRLALDAGRMAIWEYSPASEEVTTTPEFNRIMGFDPAARPSMEEIRALCLPGERERLQTESRKAIAEGKAQFESEFRCRRPDGSLRWLLLRAEILAGDGRFDRLIGVLMDIDDRKRWEERQTLLMRELNHRVKNSLSVIQSLATQSFRGRADPGAFEDFRGRLRALAAANDVLFENEPREFELRTLLTRIIEPYVEAASRLVLDGRPVTLPPRLNVPLALVVHELATNAAKYGALSTPEGRVEIRWAPAAAGTKLSWIETGGPVVPAERRKSFGMRLIEDILNVEIGSVSTEFSPAGLRCKIGIRHGAAGQV